MLSSRVKKQKINRCPFYFFQELDFVMRRSEECSPNSRSWVFTSQGPCPVAPDHQVCLSKSWTMKGGSYLSSKEKGKGSYVGGVGEGQPLRKEDSQEVRSVSSLLYSHAWRTGTSAEDTRIVLRSFQSRKLFFYFSSRIDPTSQILSRNHQQASGNQERKEMKEPSGSERYLVTGRWATLSQQRQIQQVQENTSMPGGCMGFPCKSPK